jgi:hypothetical protein
MLFDNERCSNIEPRACQTLFLSHTMFE